MLFTALKKYTDFTGRANREEYWGLFLFVIIASIVATILDLMLFATVEISPFYVILILGVFIPSIATLARRNRDAGWSQWAFILVFIPLVNFIYYIVIGCVPTKEEKND